MFHIIIYTVTKTQEETIWDEVIIRSKQITMNLLKESKFMKKQKSALTKIWQISALFQTKCSSPLKLWTPELRKYLHPMRLKSWNWMTSFDAQATSYRETFSVQQQRLLVTYLSNYIFWTNYIMCIQWYNVRILSMHIPTQPTYSHIRYTHILHIYILAAPCMRDAKIASWFIYIAS